MTWILIGWRASVTSAYRTTVLAMIGWALHPIWLRVALLRLAGVSVGRDLRAFHGLSIRAKRSGQVVIGHRVFLNRHVDIEAGDNSSVRIGDDRVLGVEVVLAAVGHAEGTAFRRAGVSTPGPVIVGAGCWAPARRLRDLSEPGPEL